MDNGNLVYHMVWIRSIARYVVVTNHPEAIFHLAYVIKQPVGQELWVNNARRELHEAKPSCSSFQLMHMSREACERQ